MLRPRITPCLLIREGALVKTRQFTDDKYIGDPINAVKIFNEKAVDELIVIDIDATRYKREPNYSLIQRLADESRMPICYGGGIKDPGQAERIVQMGVEKVAISSGILRKPEIIPDFAQAVGQQSVVGVLDVKNHFLRGYGVYTHNGTRRVGGSLDDWIGRLQNYGVGEILINSIDRDGMQNGYDFDLVNKVKDRLTVPSTFLGGAGSLKDIAKLIKIRGVGGCAAGSLFVFKGRYRAVLINYPSFADKLNLINENLTET